MEARANHFLVGLFVLLLGSALVAFTLWVAKIEVSDRSSSYVINFTGSVTGLKEGSSVRYRGLLVGTVEALQIDPDNVEQVRVQVRINRGTPIKTDAVAALEVSGLTGNAFVQITGGTAQAPLLLPGPAGALPVIPSRPSTLAEMFDNAPRIIQRLLEVSERVARVLSPENEQRLTQTLENIHDMSSALATAARGAGDGMVQVKDAAIQMNATMVDIRQHVEKIAGGLEGTLNRLQTAITSLDDHAGVAKDEIVRTSAEARALSASLRQLSDQVAAMIQENRLPVRDFTSVGLYELSMLISEMRDVATSMARVSGSIEKGPVEFLFTGTRREEDKGQK